MITKIQASQVDITDVTGAIASDTESVILLNGALSTNFSPIVHQHNISDITSLSALLNATVNVTGDQVISGIKTFSGTIIADGDFIVNGTTTTVDSVNVNIGDNIIVLNSNATGTPSQNAGIEIARGSEPNALLLWNESTDVWVAGIGATQNKIILENDPIFNTFATGAQGILAENALPLGQPFSVIGENIRLVGEDVSGNGTTGLTIAASTSMPSDYTIVLPQSIGGPNDVLTVSSVFSGIMVLDWVSQSTSNDDIVLSAGNDIIIEHGDLGSLRIESDSTSTDITRTVNSNGLSVESDIVMNNMFQFRLRNTSALSPSNIQPHTTMDREISNGRTLNVLNVNNPDGTGGLAGDGSIIRLDSTTSRSIGIRTPQSTITSSYDIALPASPPSGTGKVLTTTTSSNTPVDTAWDFPRYTISFAGGNIFYFPLGSNPLNRVLLLRTAPNAPPVSAYPAFNGSVSTTNPTTLNNIGNFQHFGPQITHNSRVVSVRATLDLRPAISPLTNGTIGYQIVLYHGTSTVSGGSGLSYIGSSTGLLFNTTQTQFNRSFTISTSLTATSSLVSAGQRLYFGIYCYQNTGYVPGSNSYIWGNVNSYAIELQQL